MSDQDLHVTIVVSSREMAQNSGEEQMKALIEGKLSVARVVLTKEVGDRRTAYAGCDDSQPDWIEGSPSLEAESAA